MTNIRKLFQNFEILSGKGLSLYDRYWIYALLGGLLALSGIGIGRFLWATNIFGIGINGDSVAYIWAARNLAKGLGLGRLNGIGVFKPMTNWAPLYPILLSLFEKGGIGAIAGARWLGAFLYGANIFLVGLILIRMTRSIWCSVTGALIMLLTPGFMVTSLSAMSDPLFIFMSLLGIIILDYYLKTVKTKWLVCLGVISALTCLTRYIGLSLILTSLLVIALQFRWLPAKRMKDGMILCAITFLPMALWFLRNYLLTNNAANRPFGFYPIQPGELIRLAELWSSWLNPVHSIFAIGFGKIILSVIAFLYLLFVIRFRKFVQSWQKGLRSQLVLILAVHSLIYPALLIISRLFFDQDISIYDERFSSPIFINLLILVIYLAHTAWEKSSYKLPAAGAVLTVLYIFVAVSFIRIYSIEGSRLLQQVHDTGSGYGAILLTESELVEQLRHLPANYVIFTDSIERLYFYTQRYSFAIQEFDQNTVSFIRENESKSNGVILAFFRNTPELIVSVVTNLPEMKTYYKAGDGLIYISRSP